jgi:cation:H+ antiporter
VLHLVLLLLGGALAYHGAARLVDGATLVVRRFGLSPLVVGLTIASYGTTAPELSVSLTAALQGQSAVVLGTMIGANIANIGLVLGLVVLLRRPAVHALYFRREVPYLLIATLAAGPVLLDQRLSPAEGVLFLSSALVFTAVSVHFGKSSERTIAAGPAVTPPAVTPPAVTPATDLRPAELPRPVLGPLLLVLAGVVCSLAGGRLLVDGATGLARDLGASEREISLTLVALACTAPEVATAIVAMRRGLSELVVGHVIGANLLNLLFVLGLTTLLSPVHGRLAEVRFELVVMTLLAFALAASVHRARRVTRAEGFVYLTGYGAFLLGLWLLH